MTNVEAIKLLLEFQKSIQTVTQKQDELLRELVAIRSLLLALLNGGVALGGGRSVEALCIEVQELVERKVTQANPEAQAAAKNAGMAFSAFVSTLENPNGDGPLS